MNKSTILLSVLLCLQGVSTGFAQQAEPGADTALAEVPADTPETKPIPAGRVSFKISRLLCFALDADILPHMRLPRGVPGSGLASHALRGDRDRRDDCLSATARLAFNSAPGRLPTNMHARPANCGAARRAANDVE
jgi:hypothetical protein